MPKHQHHSRLVGIRINRETRKQIGAPDRAVLSFVCQDCGEFFECEYRLSRSTVGAFDLNAGIKVLAESNPKRLNTAAHSVFALYAESPTVGDFLKNHAALDVPHKQAAKLYLRWDLKHGFIALS